MAWEGGTRPLPYCPVPKLAETAKEGAARCCAPAEAEASKGEETEEDGGSAAAARGGGGRAKRGDGLIPPARPATPATP